MVIEIQQLIEMILIQFVCLQGTKSVMKPRKHWVYDDVMKHMKVQPIN